MYCFDCGTKLVGCFCHNCGRKEPRFSLQKNSVVDQQTETKELTIAEIYKEADDDFIVAAAKYQEAFNCTFLEASYWLWFKNRM